MFFVQLGNCICQFQSYQEIGIPDNWKWKLDPYLIENNEDTSADLKFHLSAEDLLVREKEQKLSEDFSGFFAHQVHRALDGGTIWSYIRKRNEEVYLQYYVNQEWDQVQLLQDNTQSAGTLAFEYLGRIVPGLFLQRDFLTFHGVLLEYEGNGIILSADSGTGKTTHARLWRDTQNALIINGDRAVCQKKNGVWTGFGFPWSGTSGEQINRSVPIKAFVVLERGSRNEANRICGLEAFGAMFPHLQYPRWDREMSEKALNGLEKMLQDLPIIRLRCLPNRESVEVLKERLETLE